MCWIAQDLSMKDTTYKSGDKRFSFYDPNRGQQFDDLGKSFAKEFCEQRGWTVEIFDKKNNLDHLNTDFRIYKDCKNGNGGIYRIVKYAEAEIKRVGFYNQIVHIPARKGKMIEKIKTRYNDGDAVFLLFNEDGSAVICIPSICIEEAMCVSGYVKYEINGTVSKSEHYSVDGIHGCTTIFKWTNTDKAFSHFYAIPRTWCNLWIKTDGEWNESKKFGVDTNGMKHNWKA